MLQPARTKYRKQQKGRNKGIATRGSKGSFGEFGLKALTRGKQVTMQDLAAFIDGLDVGPETKARLKALRPETYTGLAGLLARK